MKEEKKEIKVRITLDADAISEFMLYQIYTGVPGVAVLVLGALWLVQTLSYQLAALRLGGPSRSGKPAER